MDIRTQRKKYGLTQIEVARGVGATEQTVRNWERGASEPRDDMMMALQKFFEAQATKCEFCQTCGQLLKSKNGEMENDL